MIGPFDNLSLLCFLSFVSLHPELDLRTALCSNGPLPTARFCVALFLRSPNLDSVGGCSVFSKLVFLGGVLVLFSLRFRSSSVFVAIDL